MTNKFDKSDEKLREQYEEAFFQELMEGYDEYQGEKLRREAEAENSEGPSAELIAQMEAKIAKEINRQKRMKAVPKLRRFGKYVAIFFVAIAAVFSVSFVTVDAFRTKILNFIFVDQGVSISHGLREEPAGALMPSYIPDNLSAILYSDDKDPIQILLESNDGTYFVNIYISTDRSNLLSDAENMTNYDDISINGMAGEYSEKDGRIILVWGNTDKTLMASMNTNLTKTEALKIAESINLE